MRMQSTWRGGVLFGLLFSLLVIGCGSGDEGETSTGTAAGLWTGTAVELWPEAPNTGRPMWGAVAKDGQFWFWKAEIGDPTKPCAVLFGKGTMGGGSFSANSATEAGYCSNNNWWFDGIVTGTQTERRTFQGELVPVVGSPPVMKFTVTFDPKSDRTASLAKIAGTYQGLGNMSMPPGAPLTVTSDGRFIGNTECLQRSSPWTNGCPGNGTIIPHETENMYDVILNPDRSNPGVGIAIFDEETGVLSLLAIEDTAPFAYVGKKIE